MASDPDNPMEYMATAFNGRDLETGSIFSEDESDDEEQERWRKRFKRRVTVQPSKFLSNCFPRTCSASLPYSHCRL